MEQNGYAASYQSNKVSREKGKREEKERKEKRRYNEEKSEENRGITPQTRRSTSLRAPTRLMPFSSLSFPFLYWAPRTVRNLVPYPLRTHPFKR